jgi:prephenate dehydrogenase
MAKTGAVQSVGIIGYGRFGRLLVELFKKTHPTLSLQVYSRSHDTDDETFFSKENVYSSDLVILAVPIGVFADSVSDLAPHLKPGQTVMEVCSVKIFPRKVLTENLPETVGVICSHPMFGPATYQHKDGSLSGLTTTLENVRGSDAAYTFVKDFFLSLNLHVVEIDAVEHDRLASKFQFVTLSNAMILRPLALNRTRIDTASASALHHYLEMISVDKQLVKDLYTYNPFCKEQFERLDASFEEFRKFIDLED